MKIRMVALAGVAALALTGPAFAGDETGWYVDLSGGYDHMVPIRVTDSTINETQKIPLDNTALVTGAWGYRFHDRIRLEGEIGYDSHQIASNQYDASGHLSILSFLANIAYDVPLSRKWDLSFGVGAGTGIAHGSATEDGDTLSDTQAGYMWQGFVGFAYSIRENVDLTLDWRYRSLSINKRFSNDYGDCIRVACADDIHIKDTDEQAVMVGIRWYPWYAPPPPPPPPAPPPPPPPPPMAKPVTTFIVFFDFNKSNLTAEAQSVVAEAVKVAKANGFVKVEVTGHTDTVGSDSYNMGLSVRRAEAVKDEMVREGMDGSGIAIQGKSFHDPLVPTGPGVREPQNRRAVIDLGS
jgi:OOP family OmpA-OmpF porin